MKRIYAAAMAVIFVFSAVLFAAGAAIEPEQQKRKIVLFVGAVEKIENDKYTMRKVESRYEFYIEDSTLLLLREEGSAERLNEKNYVVIKGPKNKNTVLANAVYVYESIDEYGLAADKKDEDPDAPKKVFSSMLEGVVIKKDPVMIRTEDGREYTVSHDDETYWMLIKRSNKGEIKPGERIKIYFDKFYSIRVRNVPIKVVIDRIKAGF